MRAGCASRLGSSALENTCNTEAIWGRTHLRIGSRNTLLLGVFFIRAVSDLCLEWLVRGAVQWDMRGFWTRRTQTNRHTDIQTDRHNPNIFSRRKKRFKWPKIKEKRLLLFFVFGDFLVNIGEVHSISAYISHYWRK